MQKWSAYIIPLILASILIYGLIKKVNPFDCFLEGASEGIGTLVRLIPTLIGVMVAVEMMRASGALDVLCSALTPVGRALGIPREVMPLTVLTPISGSGSLAVFEGILRSFGPDSFVGRVASVMMGSTETTFYTAALYYGSIGVTKTRQTIPAALCADLTSFIVSVLAVSFLIKG